MQLDVITPNTPARTGGELLCPKPLHTDIRVERNRLLGAHGDAINAILAAAGHNLRLLVAWLRALCALLWAALVVRHDACRAAPTPA